MRTVFDKTFFTSLKYVGAVPRVDLSPCGRGESATFSPSIGASLEQWTAFRNLLIEAGLEKAARSFSDDSAGRRRAAG